jgi:hypothetical protein
MPAMNSAPLVVADRAGFFASEGVKIELELFTSQLNRETALQAGRIDGTVSDLINAIQAWARGFPLRVTSASQGVFSLLAAPAAGPASLTAWKSAGRKVATGLLENSTVYYVAEKVLGHAGIDSRTIELVPVMQVPARLELLLAGKVEAAVLPEPLATLRCFGERGGWRIQPPTMQRPGCCSSVGRSSSTGAPRSAHSTGRTTGRWRNSPRIPMPGVLPWRACANSRKKRKPAWLSRSSFPPTSPGRRMSGTWPHG